MPLLRAQGELTLGSDPELRFTQTGKAVCSFSAVASKSKKDESGNWVDDKSAWFKVTVWDKMAEHAAASFSKGSRILVIGDVHQEEYEKDGVKRTSLCLTAHEIAASVRFGETTFVKAERNNSATPAAAPAGQANPWQSDSAALPF